MAQIQRGGPLLPMLLATIVRIGALSMFFSGDDIIFLARARGLEPMVWSFARLLSGPLRWMALNAMFGLHPSPYLAVGLGLHLVAVALVWRVARRLGLGAQSAIAAAILFGVSAVAFTPLHWASGGGEILMVVLSLLAFDLFLSAREEPRAIWLAVAALIAALLCKESALLLPLVFALAAWAIAGAARVATRARPTREIRAEREGAAPKTAPAFAAWWKPLAPLIAVAVLDAVALAITLKRGEFLGGEAYATSLDFHVWLANLATYLSWGVSFATPLPDLAAGIDIDAWRVAVPVAIGLLALIALSRRGRPPAVVAGAAWFLLMLAPVLPLTHHTYFYYLYLPWAGACWMLCAIGEGLAARWPWVARVTLAALVVLVAVEDWRTHAREQARVGDLYADRTVRESELLRNVSQMLDTLRVPAGSRLAFVNPAPRRHTALVDTTGRTRSEYIPLEAALRGGEAIRLFRPELGYAGFAATIPREWESAQALIYSSRGHARSIGSGSHALAALGYECLELHELPQADTLFARSLALGDTLPDALFGSVAIASIRGDAPAAARWGAVFARRFPADPRNAAVAQTLHAMADRATTAPAKK